MRRPGQDTRWRYRLVAHSAGTRRRRHARQSSGYCCGGSGDRASALASLENGLERFPTSSDLHAELGRYLIADGSNGRGRRHLEAAMKSEGDASRRAHRTLADALFKQKEYDEAGALLDSYRARHPG